MTTTLTWCIFANVVVWCSGMLTCKPVNMGQPGPSPSGLKKYGTSGASSFFIWAVKSPIQPPLASPWTGAGPPQPTPAH
ncbi:Uncharacterized protein TCM_009922 [Theobroma cacao]|uniref:Secreted protein n=1 Tax=Theobroma cacao TaxID=3641 RepID=A0A061E5G2_THECC|nr:Uncharacterized protein TCM_009922 [Theobroma cacao]